MHGVGDHCVVGEDGASVVPPFIAVVAVCHAGCVDEKAMVAGPVACCRAFWWRAVADVENFVTERGVVQAWWDGAAVGDALW